MKASNFFISTYKEAPADAEIISHKLMLRAGLIKKISSGIYTYMPMGLRIIHKVENIVRNEMNKANAIELTLPIVQPAELWQETGRFEQMGAELLRIKDRHQRDFVIQPTSEEIITDLAKQELKSYKQLPKNFYQIQTKFRDERRPRFGLMRGREFIMKDAYSFDTSMQNAKKSYQIMVQVYRNIFDKFGLKYRSVSADSGNIGGDLSEEFQVIANTGEDIIVFCPNSNYAANIEKAYALAPTQNLVDATENLTKVATPNTDTCEKVAQLLNIPITKTVKSIVLASDNFDENNLKVNTTIWLLLLRGDHNMNETKVKKIKQLNNYRFASLEEIEQNFNSKPGYLGPINLNKNIKIIADNEVAVMSDWVCGANEENYHYTGVNWKRDLKEPFLICDIRNVVEGDKSPDGKGFLSIERGIEIGHVFYLGTKYSKTMNATFLDKDGKAQFYEMGCYGLGISRLLAAAIEQNNDEKGIIWPESLAPFSIVICPIGYNNSTTVTQQTDLIYKNLLDAGIDVILDDRNERPGVMFNDWDLIGIPHRLVISERNLINNQIEYKDRKKLDIELIYIDDILTKFN